MTGCCPRNPCSRRTSPGAARQRPYVATTEQVWELHDAMPERLRIAVLLGGFVGLRTAEACGLRADDVDFMRGIVRPAVQYPAAPLKTDTSRTAIPVPEDLTLALAAQVAQWPSPWLLTNEYESQLGPWQLERAVRTARTYVEGFARRVPLPRPTALPGVAADSRGSGCEGRAGAAAPRFGQDDAGHIRPPVAGRRRIHASRRCRGFDGSRGPFAD